MFFSPFQVRRETMTLVWSRVLSSTVSLSGAVGAAVAGVGGGGGDGGGGGGGGGSVGGGPGGGAQVGRNVFEGAVDIRDIKEVNIPITIKINVYRNYRFFSFLCDKKTGLFNATF